MMKIIDTFPSAKHVHTKYDYNFWGFTDPLKLIQILLCKKEAKAYLKYFVALNFDFRSIKTQNKRK